MRGAARCFGARPIACAAPDRASRALVARLFRFGVLCCRRRRTWSQSRTRLDRVPLFAAVAAVWCARFARDARTPRRGHRAACRAGARRPDSSTPRGARESRLADALPAAWEGRDINWSASSTTCRSPPIAASVSHSPSNKSSRRMRLCRRDCRSRGTTAASRCGVKRCFRRCTPASALRTLRALRTVRLKRPHGTVNPHGFDVEAWLLENDLRATGYVRNDEGNRRARLHSPAARTTMVDARASRYATTSCARSTVVLTRACIAALAIGDERAIPAEQWQLFNRTGVGHLISISGLHITFFAALIGGLRYGLWRTSHALTMRLPARKAAAVAGVFAAFVYVLLAGFRSSGATHALHADGCSGRPLARPAGHRVDCLAVGAGGGARHGIRGRRSPPASGCRSARWACLLYIGVGRDRRDVRLARRRARADGDHTRPHSADADALPADFRSSRRSPTRWRFRWSPSSSCR